MNVDDQSKINFRLLIDHQRTLSYQIINSDKFCIKYSLLNIDERELGGGFLPFDSPIGKRFPKIIEIEETQASLKHDLSACCFSFLMMID